jgi:hypothetical protein
VTLALLAALAVSACSGRSAPAGDAGSDRGGPGSDGPGGGCTATDPTDCQAQGCQWQSACGGCGGTPAGGSCVPAGTPEPECPPVDCFSCASLDQVSCQQNPACRADFCMECSCTPTFVGCSQVGAPPAACPALGCAPQCDCSSFDQATCEANAGRCTVNSCPDCNGTMTFAGCLNAGETGACPAIACQAGCRTNNDCQSQGGGICSPPGTPPFCGTCMPPPNPCTTDQDCVNLNASTICGPNPSACGCGGMTCIPPCQSDASCATGESCGTNGHCAPTACTGSSGCPADFACVSGGAGASATCQRVACAADTDCTGGFCVAGGCYDSLGFCQQPVP